MRNSFLALVAAAFASCATPGLSIQPRYGEPSLSGSVGVSSGGVGGAADLEQAGLDDDQAVSARVDLDFGSPHLIGLAQAPEFSGSGTLDVTISDGTNTIVAGSPVDSRIDLGIYDLALVFDLVPGDTVEVALGFGAAYLDLDFEFDAGGGNMIASDESVPVPLLAAAASVWIGPVQLGGYAGGISGSYEGDSLTFLDADVYGRLKLLGGSERLRASLVLGYRLTSLDIDYDDGSEEIDVDFKVDGPYVGLELSL